MSLAQAIASFDKSGLKPTETVVRNLPIYGVNDEKPGYGMQTEEELEEHFDSTEVLHDKVATLATMIAESKHMVFFTGAGVSTAAKIPDFRSRDGVWTLQEAGYIPKSAVTMEAAKPTLTHLTMASMVDGGVCKHVISQNVDGLHLRSGIAEEDLSELHGNCYVEQCPECGARYARPFDVTAHSGGHELQKVHQTGRLCSAEGCSGMLQDNIINFEENLDADILNRAWEESQACDLMICVGSSLRVTPAADMPKLVARNGGQVVVINLQGTPLDNGKNVMRIGAKCDDVFTALNELLGVEPKAWEAEQQLSVGNVWGSENDADGNLCLSYRLLVGPTGVQPLDFVASVTAGEGIELMLDTDGVYKSEWLPATQEDEDRQVDVCIARNDGGEDVHIGWHLILHGPKKHLVPFLL